MRSAIRASIHQCCHESSVWEGATAPRRVEATVFGASSTFTPSRRDESDRDICQSTRVGAQHGPQRSTRTPMASALLERDVANLCHWARRHGVARDRGAVCAEVMAAIL